jgi:hypothetical protein
VAPIIFVTELMVPMLLAVAVGGEKWRPGLVALSATTAGLGVLIVSVLALMRTPALSGLLVAQDLGPRMNQRMSGPLATA